MLTIFVNCMKDGPHGSSRTNTVAISSTGLFPNSILSKTQEGAAPPTISNTLLVATVAIVTGSIMC